MWWASELSSITIAQRVSESRVLVTVRAARATAPAPPRHSRVNQVVQLVDVVVIEPTFSVERVVSGSVVFHVEIPVLFRRCVLPEAASKVHVRPAHVTGDPRRVREHVDTRPAIPHVAHNRSIPERPPA